MINLTPKTEKKKIIKNFYYRLIVLFLFMLSISVIVATLAILPSYFLSLTNKNVTNDKLKMQEAELTPVPDQETLSAIKDLNSKLALIEKSKDNEFVVSRRVINATLAKKIAGVEITNITYNNSISLGRLINIEGRAPSREVLLAFRLALEEGEIFKEVDLPISNFVKGSDIEFSLSLTPS